MIDAHYIAKGAPVGLTEDFLRTFEVARAEPESLVEPAVIDRLLKAHRVEAADAGMDDVTAARIVREDLRKLFDRESDSAAVSALNEYLVSADIGVNLQLSGESRLALVPFVKLHQDSVRTLRSLCLLEIADAVSRKGIGCLRTCQAAPCQDAFIDRTKKGGRRFCSLKCSNRLHVQRHRKRLKS